MIRTRIFWRFRQEQGMTLLLGLLFLPLFSYALNPGEGLTVGLPAFWEKQGRLLAILFAGAGMVLAAARQLRQRQREFRSSACQGIPCPAWKMILAQVLLRGILFLELILLLVLFTEIGSLFWNAFPSFLKAWSNGGWEGLVDRARQLFPDGGKFLLVFFLFQELALLLDAAFLFSARFGRGKRMRTLLLAGGFFGGGLLLQESIRLFGSWGMAKWLRGPQGTPGEWAQWIYRIGEPGPSGEVERWLLGMHLGIFLLSLLLLLFFGNRWIAASDRGERRGDRD